MKPRVLFLSIDGMTDPLGQSQVIPYQAGLARKGYDITIISCEKKENLLRNEKAVRTLLDEAGIKWKYSLYSKKIPLLSQRGNLKRLKELAMEEAGKSKSDLIVHCRSYLPALAGMDLKKKFGVKMIFDMRGFWADERVEGAIWKLKNPVHRSAYKYFKRKEKQLISEADQIVTLSNQAKDIIEGWNIRKDPPISTIPCCVDLEHFKLKSEGDVTETRKKLGISESAFVLGYLGSLGTWYMLDEMLDLFVEAHRNNNSAVLAFITPDKAEPIVAAAKKKGISTDRLFIRSATRNEVPGLISIFNAGLFFIRPTFSKKASSPTKMAEILACGVPVITNSGIGDCDQIIRETNCGVIVEQFTAKAYQLALSQLEKNTYNPKYLNEVAGNYFSLEKGIDEYDKIYRGLILPGKAAR